MSLHGDLRINGRYLGSWSATNTRKTDASGTLYRCEAVDGLPGSTPVAFEVRHRAEDGAAALAVAVLSAAIERGFVAAEPPVEERRRDTLFRLFTDGLDDVGPGEQSASVRRPRKRQRPPG